MLSEAIIEIPKASYKSLAGWVVVAILSIPILTYLQSLFRYILSQAIKNGSQTPPQIPYFLPFIGNAFSMLTNTEKFLLKHQKKFGAVPFQLRLGPKRMTYVSHGEEIRTLFARSHELLSTPLLLSALLKFFGMPQEDINMFEDDKSGYLPTPAPGFENMDPNKRVNYGQRKEFLTFLQGRQLEKIGENFSHSLIRLFEADTMITTDDWTYVPDLYDFMRRRLFRASVDTIYGEALFSLCPTLYEDFWTYESNIRPLVQGFPRWLAPKAYQSLDRMHDNLKLWGEYLEQRVDWDADDSDVDYNPLFGSPLIQAMQRRWRATGMTETGKAANALGLLIASNANEVPAVIWSLLEIILSKDTTNRVLTEISAAFDAGSAIPDPTQLSSSPLLTSIFMETMRVRSPGSVVRVCTTDNLPFGRWVLPKDSLVMATTWLAGRDETFWNVGQRLPNGQFEHPLDGFWPERFLSYPDDPTSGPIRKHGDYTSAVKNRKRTSEDDKRATVVTSGLSNHYFPFGGGPAMCPGRSFAKHEVVTSIALTLRMFEIELVDHEDAGKTRSDMTRFPFGSLAFDRKVPIRIRRRKLD